MPIPQTHEIMKYKSAKERVYEVIKQWIIEGKLVPNEKISDIEIAEHFDVSRTPVREAFQLLEQQKLVESHPGKSTIVTDIPKDAIDQWYLPMLALQKLAASLAADRVTKSDIERLQQLNKNFEYEVSHPGSPLDRLYADKDFHDAILEISGNSYIMDFCETLWIHILRLEYSFFKGSTTLVESIAHHQQMIDSLNLKDGFSAGLAMEKNWGNTIVMIQNLINQTYPQ